MAKPVLKSSYTEAWVNYYKSSIGAGVLAAPYTLAVGGWGLGIVIFTVIPMMILVTTLVRILDTTRN